MALVAVRPVTDTIKTVVDDRIEGTIDRERTARRSPRRWWSPAGLLAEAATRRRPCTTSPPGRAGCGRAVDVELVRAPSLGRRVEHPRAVHLLECVDEVGHRVRRVS